VSDEGRGGGLLPKIWKTAGATGFELDRPRCNGLRFLCRCGPASLAGNRPLRYIRPARATADRSKLPERAGGVINTAFVLEDRPLACFFAAPGETVTRTNALGSTPARRIRPAAAEGPRSLGPSHWCAH
jgi:hypothetical protein